MNTRGFTLIEILAAAVVSAIVLIVIYGTFQRAVHTRDNAQERTRQARLRTRAVDLLRSDLRAAYLSGGLFACTMEGGKQSQKSRFPGYLRFTATSGANRPGESWGDVQQIEYYLLEDNAPTADLSAGILVRAITRDLLTTPALGPEEQQILGRVQTFEPTFYDGQNWQDRWPADSSTAASGTTATLPRAIRVRLQQTAPGPRLPVPPPVDILVPLTTEALTSATASTTGT